MIIHKQTSKMTLLDKVVLNVNLHALNGDSFEPGRHDPKGVLQLERLESRFSKTPGNFRFFSVFAVFQKLQVFYSKT
jgi:hypothetical protein